MTKEQFKKAKKLTDRIVSLESELSRLKKEYPILGQSFFTLKFSRTDISILDTEVCNIIVKKSIEIIEGKLIDLRKEFQEL